MDLQTGHLEDSYHARIILLLLFIMKFFSESFFPQNCNFCLSAQENQTAFSKRCSLINSILQGLVKICKKYIGVNHFSLKSSSLEK